SGALPGLAVPQGLFGRRHPPVGQHRLHDRRHRLPRLQAAGHRRHPARTAALARARRAVPDEPEARALDRRDGHRARAHRRAPDDEGRPRRHGTLVLNATEPIAMAGIHITDIESAINWWRAHYPSPDGIMACPEVLALAEVYALMV